MKHLNTLFKAFLALIVFMSYFLIFSKTSFARSGCCSYHGGVCGCGCCDGTPLSDTCAPYYPSCVTENSYEYTPINNYEFPQMNATWEWTPRQDKAFDIKISLADPIPSQYSATLNKCKGCDPGPKADFYSNTFYFSNIKTGKYYLNVKKEISGYWSTVTYFDIELPKWTPPVIPTAVPIVNYYQDSNDTTSAKEEPITDNTISNLIFASLAIAGVVWIYNKKQG